MFLVVMLVGETAAAAVTVAIINALGMSIGSGFVVLLDCNL